MPGKENLKNSQEFYRSHEKPRTLTEIFHNKRIDFDLKYPAHRPVSSTGLTVHAATKWLREMFLPVGYPYSVHRCYAKVHLFQFIETIAAQLVTVITAQALLTAVGTTSDHSTGAAVAIQWTITNGFGEIGKLVVIQQYSYLFDSYPKTSKLVGELCCIVGNGCHIVTLFAPDYYLLFASLGYCLYGVYLSVWAATHTTFNSHLAMKDNNMGDLNAKDDSQVSLAHILGLLGGISLLSFSSESLYLFGVYLVFSAIQVVMTLMLVMAANYEVLNFARMRLTSHAFVHRNRTLSCLNLRGRENWTGEFITIKGMPKIRLARHVKDAMRDDWIAERLSILKVSSASNARTKTTCWWLRTATENPNTRFY
ncbi:hypothetical protein HDV03_004719 [Kappamyces sp. JEL0829]|nr:hypothetical protein HDV03_004719 [Kappamyces sp. JEL0829]